MCANNTELAKCSSGVLNGSKCHKNDFTRRPCLFKAEEIERGKLRLIKWRSGFCHLNTICHHHKIKYLQRFEKNQMHRCDPFRRHSKFIRSKFILLYSFFVITLMKKLNNV